MTEPHPHSTSPRTEQGDVDIEVDSNATAAESPVDEPSLTTSEDAQRDDLLVEPANS